MRHPEITVAAAAVLFIGLGLGLASCADTGPPNQPIPLHGRTAVTTATGQSEFPGFRPVMKDGVQYFCQKGSPTGTRVRAEEQCYTRDVLQAMEKNNREFFNDMSAQGSHDTLHMDSPR